MPHRSSRPCSRSQRFDDLLQYPRKNQSMASLLPSKISTYSTERLFRFLNALGSNVEIRIIANPQPNIEAKTLVILGHGSSIDSQILGWLGFILSSDRRNEFPLEIKIWIRSLLDEFFI
jgi:hypothetical protein